MTKKEHLVARGGAPKPEIRCSFTPDRQGALFRPGSEFGRLGPGLWRLVFLFGPAGHVLVAANGTPCSDVTPAVHNGVAVLVDVPLQGAGRISVHVARNVHQGGAVARIKGAGDEGIQGTHCQIPAHPTRSTSTLIGRPLSHVSSQPVRLLVILQPPSSSRHPGIKDTSSKSIHNDCIS